MKLGIAGVVLFVVAWPHLAPENPERPERPEAPAKSAEPKASS